MTRVLSGAALIVFTVLIVWFAPARVFQAVAFALLCAAVIELVGLARATGLDILLWLPLLASFVTLAAFIVQQSGDRDVAALPVVLMMPAIAIPGAAMARSTKPDKHVLARVAASLLPSLYLALPIGAMVAIRASEGPSALFLMMLTVMISDTAQYYSGRLLGRTPLAPAISPNKTVEGAVGGFIFGALAFAIAGAFWLPRLSIIMRLAVGLALVALGIAGDLFESMLKRSAGVKDSSRLIPGHGGVLDRIDALLFAAPVYYVVLQYA